MELQKTYPSIIRHRPQRGKGRSDERHNTFNNE